jgi:chorismate mutase / prephenate dehydratase
MAMSLDRFRQQIDEIDEKIVPLLAERAACAHQIGQEKRRRGAPLLDPGREQKVIERVQRLNPGPLEPDEIAAIYAVIMAKCTSVQARSEERNTP